MSLVSLVSTVRTQNGSPLWIELLDNSLSFSL